MTNRKRIFALFGVDCDRDILRRIALSAYMSKRGSKRLYPFLYYATRKSCNILFSWQTRKLLMNFLLRIYEIDIFIAHMESQTCQNLSEEVH